MGGLVIETVRPGVQFTPEAADAFRRSDAQVMDEFGRHIDVNSTYRSWADQMLMFVNWGKYVASGYKPSLYPGHSKAVHPSESFHVSGTALDSDDWVNARIVEILAENGFIRNRLHVPNERHHFEYLRDRDKNIGRPATGGNTAPAPIIPVDEEEDEDMSTNVMYQTIEQGSKYPIRAAVTNDESGLWIELVDDKYDTINRLANRYKTGDGVVVSASTFKAARNAAAQIRPQTSIQVIVGEPDA